MSVSTSSPSDPPVRKTHASDPLRHFILDQETINLPRQARGKHRENSTRDAFPAGFGYLLQLADVGADSSMSIESCEVSATQAEAVRAAMEPFRGGNCSEFNTSLVEIVQGL
jgi:hypothetical protein